MHRLEWETLLCKKRAREPYSAVKKPNTNSVIVRNAFEADYDRIVGSSSVRRLQDKAQVFPLQENDFTRTRLTHSMEVSALARSLGKAVGRQLELIPEYSFSPEMTDELAALLQTAGLIHDLGNPPFGHYGETVIRSWFAKWFDSNKLLKKRIIFSEQEKQDFIYFDGNVQNLRIVTKLQTLNDAYGANFTYGTLATIIKYPWKSDAKETQESNKFGYFKSEEKLVKEIQKATGLAEGKRHPATYLLEAADDIIYICDDIEDGVKKGYIPWEQVYAHMKENFKDDKYKELFEEIDEKSPDENIDEKDRLLAKVRMFRNFTQGYLLKKAIDEFIDNYNDIMSGTYQKKELLICEEAFTKYLKREITGRYCFSCQEVLGLELVGDRVIKTLLDVFVSALTENDWDDLLNVATYPGKIYNLISSNFKYIALYDYESKGKKEYADVKMYDKLHLAVDFISGMTDSYAVNLYKELTGIKLPQ